jgi:catechol 2,3-dioxygenase-like lactoylglutathione lyase family enzyme
MKIDSIDHFVLPVRDIPATVAFYVRALGMTEVTFGDGRKALAFGRQKINLHPAGWDYEPKARHPVAGSGDFCLLTTTPLADVRRHLEAAGVAIELGPVERTGAEGPIVSLYVRDPDGNLVEIANRKA